MSDDELIVRLGIQSRQADKRLTRAQLEAQQIAKAMRSIAHVLDVGVILDPVELEKECALLPTRDEIFRLLREIEEAREAKNKAESDLKKAESIL